MTEEQAKLFRCPFLTITSARDGDLYTASPDYCIGSECMMWRHGNVGDKSIAQLQTENAGLNYNEGGYCGLAK